MKKLIVPLLMVLGLAACKKEPAPVFDFVLKNQMVQVNGLSQDYLLQVNAADKTVFIEVAYADKAELAALEVEFVGLPEDVAVEPQKSTFNYSAGASQKVTFTQNTLTEEYTVSAQAALPEPHFTSFMVAGVEVAGNSFKIKGSADRSKLPVSFTVSPANTKVFVGGVEIVSATEEAPNEIDFTDKVAGVDFVLKCDEVTETVNVKAITTGINEVERVWGRYVKPVTAGADTWWTEVIPASDQNMRTMAMDDNYIYLAKTNKTLYAVDVKNPANVKAMPMEGYEAGGVFGSCALATMDKAEGGSVVLLSNMVNSTASEFVIWKWDGIDSNPEKVLSYHLPEAARIGDQMSVEGNWANGKIWFHDFTSQQKAYVFTVKDGAISTTAEVVAYDAKQGNWSAMYKYDDTQYIGGGPGAKSRLFKVEGGTATTLLELPGAYFANPLHGIRFFSFNEQDYMTYVVLRNSYQDGQMRLTELNGESLQASLETPGHTYKYGLGDPEQNDITADKNGNGLGNSILRIVGGEIYIASYVPGAGLSLFHVK